MSCNFIIHFSRLKRMTRQIFLHKVLHIILIVNFFHVKVQCSLVMGTCHMESTHSLLLSFIMKAICVLLIRLFQLKMTKKGTHSKKIQTFQQRLENISISCVKIYSFNYISYCFCFVLRLPPMKP